MGQPSRRAARRPGRHRRTQVQVFRHQQALAPSPFRACSMADMCIALPLGAEPITAGQKRWIGAAAVLEMEPRRQYLAIGRHDSNPADRSRATDMQTKSNL
jgi:hypothetical protein